jgi:hypothetical protein
MQHPRVFPILVTAILTTACAPHIESAQFNAAPAPTRVQDVRVYTTKVPDCDYDEVGIVSGPATDLFTSLQKIVDAMRTRAAAMGGDALVNLRLAAPVTTEAVPGTSAPGKPGYLATVVRFTTPCSGP